MANGLFVNHVPPQRPNRSVRVALRLEDWPEQDRAAWDLACAPGELFEDEGVGAHLRPRTRTALINAYGRWLGFLTQSHPSLLSRAPSDRLTRERIAEFCTMLATTNTGVSVASTIRHVRQALLLIRPGTDLNWLLTIARQIEARSPPRRKSPRLQSLLELYQLGLDLMNEAEAQIEHGGRIPNRAAIAYRDGLTIALLVEAPMRRTNLTSLQIGRHLVRTGAVL